MNKKVKTHKPRGGVARVTIITVKPARKVKAPVPAIQRRSEIRRSK
jgi:hypothetical protein